MVRSIALMWLVSLLGFLFAADEPGVDLIDDRLRLDATVSSSAHLWQVEQGGVTNGGFTVDNVLAPVGLTGRLDPAASLRASCDMGALEPQDLYVDLAWSSGFGLRAGQFKLPLGVDQTTDPERVKLAYGSLLATYARPVDLRDVGISGSWMRDRAGVVLAVVAGNGPNVLDDNDRKDVCGRVVAEPWTGSGVEVAVRGYYGWPHAAEAAWRTAALEVVLERKALSISAELQNHESDELHSNAGYVQLAYRVGMFEPACRFDVVMPRREKPEFMATGGVNMRLLSDHLRLMLDGLYRRDYQHGLDVAILVMRLQATL